MPVDFVLAISHNRLNCDRKRRIQEQKKTIFVVVNNNDANKDKICLDIFRIW